VSINNLPGSPAPSPPGARQTLIEPFFSQPAENSTYALLKAA